MATDGAELKVPPVGILPSDFMRSHRPEYYSDSEDRPAYLLDEAMLGYKLETITARNETQEFEIFCRKLCERAICPNLRPQTGPEGGGDSKADTETYPVSEQISRMWYAGDQAAGGQRWAFAFSAKKKWTEKVRSDVRGLIQTGRGYSRIICVTSRFARAKDRARLEDELKKQYGVPVTIHDRSWITTEIIEKDRKDLAFNYLGVGQIDDHPFRMGPTDYSRTRQLADIERALEDPDVFSGMERQQVTEAVLAATLSRNLERPRIETEGRFRRAIRLADELGSFRQRLDARYEEIRTGYWWFDDIDGLNHSYSEFEALVIETQFATNLELLCNLVQLLFNSVIHGHLTAEEAQLAKRTRALMQALQGLANDSERPNNSLEARTSLLFLKLYQALLAKDRPSMAPVWEEFSVVLDQARTMGEYSADRLIQLIDVFGNVAADDPVYGALVEKLAAFVAERKGEAEGALILLKRAEQLDFDCHFEMIRLLGKAARQLTKREYASKLIEALQLLSLAYRSAGLLWAARATCVFACASIVIESETESELRVDIIPTMKIWAWVAMELRHLPDLLSLVQLLNGSLASLPLTDESKAKVTDDLHELDTVLSCQITNFSEAELRSVSELPDVFEALGIYAARSALLYKLGYEDTLREDGSIPSSETAESVAEFFALAAAQPASRHCGGPLILNTLGSQPFGTSILGMRITLQTNGSHHSILAAEAILGSLEAFCATMLEAKIIPHTESVQITLSEDDAHSDPQFSLDPETMKGKLQWPVSVPINSFGHQKAVDKIIYEVVSVVVAATCLIRNPKKAIRNLFENEAVADRLSMIALIGNSHHRFLGRNVSRLEEWQKAVKRSYQLRPDHPIVTPADVEPEETTIDKQEKKDPSKGAPTTDHRRIKVHSVINVHLWDQAKWSGTAYLSFELPTPPVMALMFRNGDAARKIFSDWRDRFGNYDRDERIYLSIIRRLPGNSPYHYRLLITSQLPKARNGEPGQNFVLASRIQTMEPANDANLERFLSDYGRAGGYYLIPAVGTGPSEPEFLYELGIAKRELTVRNASDIEEGDMDFIGLGPSGTRR